MRQFPYELIGTNSGTNNGNTLVEPMLELIIETISNYFKSSHHVNISVNLKTIHQYLSPVKFW